MTSSFVNWLKCHPKCKRWVDYFWSDVGANGKLANMWAPRKVKSKAVGTFQIHGQHTHPPWYITQNTLQPFPYLRWSDSMRPRWRHMFMTITPSVWREKLINRVSIITPSITQKLLRPNRKITKYYFNRYFNIY